MRGSFQSFGNLTFSSEGPDTKQFTARIFGEKGHRCVEIPGLECLLQRCNDPDRARIPPSARGNANGQRECREEEHRGAGDAAP